MKLRCAIIDDEPLALDLLESYVRKTDFLQLVGRYNSAVSAMEHVREEAVDLLSSTYRCPTSPAWSSRNMLTRKLA